MQLDSLDHPAANFGFEMVRFINTLLYDEERAFF